jgi:hypothetical protein
VVGCTTLLLSLAIVMLYDIRKGDWEFVLVQSLEEDRYGTPDIGRDMAALYSRTSFLLTLGGLFLL